MLDLAHVRARALLPPRDTAERERTGAPILAELKALADAVERLLPELSSLTRFASLTSASTLTVGWRPKGALRADAPHFCLRARPDALEVLWGFSPSRGDRKARARWLAESLRRRRAHAESLAWMLSSLKASGAELRASRDDDAPIAEDEWLRTDAGAVVFSTPAHALPEGVLLARLCTDRVARIVPLAFALSGLTLAAPCELAQSPEEALESLRSLRWDERALSEGSAPHGLTPVTGSFVYDPLTGWFAPASLASLRAMCAPRFRLVTELTPSAASPPARAASPLGAVAPVGLGLHARLARWLSARGVRSAGNDPAQVIVVAGELPRAGEPPPLEALVTRVLEDPTGELAAAVAGLLSGAPWQWSDPLDPRAVAARVSPRFAANAARGVSRLADQMMLSRAVTGSLGALGECIDQPAIRPVVIAAVERALGHLDVFLPDARERVEVRRVRAWELGWVTHDARGAATLESLSRRFHAYARAAGVAFDEDLLRAFIVGLRAKPFAVLTGVSGTGKTALAQHFARFMTDALPGGASGDAAGPRVALVPVRPDWIDSRGLLGYLNVLHGEGAFEDTAALRVMLRAAANPDEPHFVILDEMNLARVEHYLAEVLSGMESGASIPLHGRPAGVSSVDRARMVPPELLLSPNLFILGTVNVDETTHAFSTKVLDRAWTWEFAPKPPTALLSEWLRERRAEPAASEDERKALVGEFTEDPVRTLVLAMGKDGVGARIDRIFDAMSANGRPFGFRVATEVLRFVHLCEREGLDTPPSWWLDHAVLGKVLPRLSGTRRDLEPVVRALLATCAPVDAHTGVALATDLLATAAKLRELLARLETEAFVTFAR